MIERIRQAVVTEPGLSRTALSQRVCQWLGWRSPSGKLREVSCRKALCELERRGMIQLPAAQRAFAAGLWEGTGAGGGLEVSRFQGTLAELGEISLMPLDARDREGSRVWNQLMASYHPLGKGPLVGAQVRYLVVSERVGWLGGLAFSAAAWQLRARDEWIGWTANARAGNLPRVVCNSRFLILPGLQVPNLASHVLARAAGRLAEDWRARYHQAPLLLESFVDESRFSGASYRAANWRRVGETCGRGRQDRENRSAQGVKGIYLLPLVADCREQLCRLPAVPWRLPSSADATDWAEQEFGRVALVDGRLRQRLLTVARDFAAQPLAPINQACGGDRAKAKGTYRLLQHPDVDLPTLLKPHIEATAWRMRAEPLVLAVQDTTSLNYSAHAATTGLGPINTRRDGAVGLLLHDTLAFTPEGVPLGLLDAHCWARDPEQAGQRETRRQRPIEQKESHKWLRSYQRVAELQPLCPKTRLVSVGDREADIYELFALARQRPKGPDLLVRADRGRQRQVAEQQPLWDFMAAQAVAGAVDLPIPGQGGRHARIAQLALRHARITLRPPNRHPGPAIELWSVHAVEEAPPAGIEAVEWLLLTTVETETLDHAVERLNWYAKRWGIEVFHRTLKSGCRIEDRRLGEADTLQACLAIDLVVAWRVFHLAKLGRETPNVPCSVFFAEAEWKALCVYQTRNPVPPSQPPSLGQAMRMTAKLGGYLDRKGDPPPGTTVLWRGLQRLEDIAATYIILSTQMTSGP